MRSMSYRQLQGWRAYMQINPFGGEREDFRAAMIRQAIINAFRDPDSDPVDVEDCMPRFGESQFARRRRAKEKAKEVPRKVKEVLGQLG